VLAVLSAEGVMTDLTVEPLAVAHDPATTRWVPVGPSIIVPPGTAYGTTLPASPTDGQEAVLVDSVTNPTYQWRFRYNAGSSSAYKWEFVGGPQIISFGTAANLGIVVPRAGDYLWDWWVNGNATGAYFQDAPSVSSGSMSGTSGTLFANTPGTTGATMTITGLTKVSGCSAGATFSHG